MNPAPYRQLAYGQNLVSLPLASVSAPPDQHSGLRQRKGTLSAPLEGRAASGLRWWLAMRGCTSAPELFVDFSGGVMTKAGGGACGVPTEGSRPQLCFVLSGNVHRYRRLNHALELISARSSALRVDCRTRENVEGTLFLPNKSLSARVAACQTSEADHLVLQRIVPIRRLARMRVARRPLT